MYTQYRYECNKVILYLRKSHKITSHHNVTSQDIIHHGYDGHHICICLQWPIELVIHTHTRNSARVHTHTHTHARTHARTHTHTHTHTHRVLNWIISHEERTSQLTSHPVTQSWSTVSTLLQELHVQMMATHVCSPCSKSGCGCGSKWGRSSGKRMIH